MPYPQEVFLVHLALGVESLSQSEWSRLRSSGVRTWYHSGSKCNEGSTLSIHLMAFVSNRITNLRGKVVALQVDRKVLLHKRFKTLCWIIFLVAETRLKEV